MALDETSSRQVVLKTPSVELRENANYRDRLVPGESVARRIDRPRVQLASIADRLRQHLIVAMDCIEGQTLGQWMTDHPKPIVLQVARGLHRKEMLHQDLRPADVMIDALGSVTLIELGAVYGAGLSEGTAEAGAQALAGEPRCAAPAYSTGDSGSQAFDLFALAVLTYQMLSGELPYGLQVTQLRGPHELHRLHYQPHYQPLRSHRPAPPRPASLARRRAAKSVASAGHQASGSAVEVHASTQRARATLHGQEARPLLQRNPLTLLILPRDRR